MAAAPIRRALLSVTDKSGLQPLASALAARGVELLSTGGTARQLREWGLPVTDVADYTGFPEVLGGRVKTLHPKIHGGLLAKRDDAEHQSAVQAHGMDPIDMVVLNLYPFRETVKQGADFDTCVENVDIGGPSMMRSAAKNHRDVVVVSSPAQYPELLAELSDCDGTTSLALRRRFAAEAFHVSASYDATVSDWLGAQDLPGDSDPASEPHVDAVAHGDAHGDGDGGGDGNGAPPRRRTRDLGAGAVRAYEPARQLKYGCNPHQQPAFVGAVGGGDMPVEVLSGSPGYINFLDAVNAWQLVREAADALGIPAAASFKHVSPAGVGLAVPLTETQALAYDVGSKELTPVALAYLRARNADPMCSFGDFAAVSDVVDEATARVLKPEVSDGIVAPGYTPEALEILRAKKGGAFIVLQAAEGFAPPDMEYREVYGLAFAQRRNDARITEATALRNVVTRGGAAALPHEARRDLLLASVAVKYTQSNSVGYAASGQMVGVGAGQQSRVDCVKLAGRKVQTWWLRQHPKVLDLRFRKGVRRPDKVNARVRYIEGDFTDAEYAAWQQLFEAVPEPLTAAEKRDFMIGLDGVSVASDAFFPFRDSIDAASRVGVKYIVQPGGSVKDDEVIAACEEYGMAMATNGMRLFHH